MKGGRFMSIIIILGLLISFLREKAIMLGLILLAIFIIVVLVRFIADLFWWGKDNDRW